MMIDAFAIVPALRQTRVKYITDLGALAKMNLILAMTIDAIAKVPAVLFTGLSKV